VKTAIVSVLRKQSWELNAVVTDIITEITIDLNSDGGHNG
jgi:hypothetical protein